MLNRQFGEASYPVGLVLFVVSIATYKALNLTVEMGAQWYRFLIFAALDAFYLSFVFLLALLSVFTRPAWLRLTFTLLIILLTLFYLVDSFVLLALDEHASLFEIARYGLEWGVVLSFFDLTALIAISLLVLCVFISLQPTSPVKRIGLFLLLLAFLAAGLGTTAPRPLQGYAMLSPQLLLEDVGARQVIETYSEEEIAFYAGLKSEPVLIPASNPDIILLIVESLSSINSNKMSGSPGILAGFDELAEQGVLFRNFFANQQASEGGLIALLGGFPPMHFPTASPYMFDEFAVQAPVIADYKSHGYRTEFLTNADLEFIGLDHFLDGLGVDRSRGRDDVDAMMRAPRVVQDAPSDAYLYRESLNAIGRLIPGEQPFLLTIATTSTHLPYAHPSGGPDTPEAVWEWSIQQLISFYSQLSETGFFENGILLITGDHRQMRPVTDAEIERYGGSARARVPLLVIGKSYPQAQIDDRFFQQSDLLRKLGGIQQTDMSLSPQPIWVERYNRKFGRIELIDKLSVFDESDQGRHEYRIHVPGNRIEWLDEKPEFSRRVESRIHKQRSIHQKTRNRQLHPAVKPR